MSAQCGYRCSHLFNHLYASVAKRYVSNTVTSIGASTSVGDGGSGGDRFRQSLVYFSSDSAFSLPALALLTQSHSHNQTHIHHTPQPHTQSIPSQSPENSLSLAAASGSGSSSSIGLHLICGPDHRLWRSSHNAKQRPNSSSSGSEKDELVPLEIALKAQELGIPFTALPQNTDFNMTNFELPRSISQPWRMIVGSFGYRISPALLNNFPGGALNIHPSLLPNYRGASPIQYSLLNDNPFSGVSLITLENEIDSGKVLFMSGIHPKSDVTIQRFSPFHTPNIFQRIEIDPHDTFLTLRHKLAQLSAVTLMAVLSDFDYYLKHARKQSEFENLPENTLSIHDKTFEWQAKTLLRAPKIDKHYGKLDFAMNAKDVYRQYRALYGFVPLWSMLGDKRVNFGAMVYYDQQPKFMHTPTALTVGSVHYDPTEDLLFVQCGVGRIGVRSVHVQNKNSPLDGKNFHNGYLHDKPPHSIKFG